MVFLRKSSGGLDLLTEARVVERFPRLREDLAALYAGYYVAQLLADWAAAGDPPPVPPGPYAPELLPGGPAEGAPHPPLFDEARATLQELGARPGEGGVR